MEFGLLHADTQWVFDEVQLMGAGCATSAQLEAFRRKELATKEGSDKIAGYVPAKSLWISATLNLSWLDTVDFEAPLGDSQRVLTVDAQASNDKRLKRLTQAKKTLRQAQCEPSSSKGDDETAYIDELASAVLAEHRTGHLTVVIVNRVKRAQELFSKLNAKLSEQGEDTHERPQVELIHSRFRLNERKAKNALLEDSESENLIIVSTQAIEAGVDISAAVMFSEIAPWSSMVQRFGRANRYGNLTDGAEIFWIDLLAQSKGEDNHQTALALPYEVEDLKDAAKNLKKLEDVASLNLPEVVSANPVSLVIRKKDLYELFDTDPDLSGFDVDVSPYIRDSEARDIRIFWRDLSNLDDALIRPNHNELCSAPIQDVKKWLKNASKSKTRRVAFIRDPQYKKTNQRAGIPVGWDSAQPDSLRPGQTILVDIDAGGYSDEIGFTGNSKDKPSEYDESMVETDVTLYGDTEGHGEDFMSEIGMPIELTAHLNHVATEVEVLCQILNINGHYNNALVRAARWHDLGKAHDVFQETMHKGLEEKESSFNGAILAKTEKNNLRHSRPYFRHELASVLAFLEHENWKSEVDLVAYMIAAHHGKVRMNIKALPHEAPPQPDNGIGTSTAKLFARGIHEGDELEAIELGGGENWKGGALTLSVMELGFNERTQTSWIERTRKLLEQLGPFQLAWLETLVRVADWRASSKEQEEAYSNAKN